MPVPSERLAGWLSPKWLVAGVALAAEGLLVNYDLRLAAAAGVLIAVVVAAWLYIAVRFGSLSGTPTRLPGTPRRTLHAPYAFLTGAWRAASSTAHCRVPADNGAAGERPVGERARSGRSRLAES